MSLTTNFGMVKVKKMICNKYVIFNERVCTKTGKNTTTNNSDKSEPMYADMGDIPESLTIESPQIEESIESCNTQLSNIPEHPTPKHVLRRSS